MVRLRRGPDKDFINTIDYSEMGAGLLASSLNGSDDHRAGKIAGCEQVPSAGSSMLGAPTGGLRPPGQVPLSPAFFLQRHQAQRQATTSTQKAVHAGPRLPAMGGTLSPAEPHKPSRPRRQDHRLLSMSVDASVQGPQAAVPPRTAFALHEAHHPPGPGTVGPALAILGRTSAMLKEVLCGADDKGPLGQPAHLVPEPEKRLSSSYAADRPERSHKQHQQPFKQHMGKATRASLTFGRPANAKASSVLSHKGRSREVDAQTPWKPDRAANEPYSSLHGRRTNA